MRDAIQSLENMMFLIVDTETHDGPPARESRRDLRRWPHIVTIAWRRYDARLRCRERASHLVSPDGFRIHPGAQRVHGISTERAAAEGLPLPEALSMFSAACRKSSVIVAHNIEFDSCVVAGECLRLGLPNPLRGKHPVCTMKDSMDHCRLPGRYGYKWPTLAELHRFLFDEDLSAAHDAASDAKHCAKCFIELVRLGVVELPEQERKAA